ncbi:MAG: 50S ribosomal protein L24 [Xanthomonadales bacterium]|jgi:large subunit ribosomal protein L24|nr:50S ribosomal protein L24 [Xanthomonadales bacterium]
MNRIKKGDDVVVRTGRSKGQRGQVISVLENNRLLVENVNMVKKHTKGDPNRGTQGGILEREAPIDASNVALYNPATGKGDRVSFKTLEDGRKVRVFRSNGEAVDI